MPIEMGIAYYSWALVAFGKLPQGCRFDMSHVLLLLLFDSYKYVHSSSVLAALLRKVIPLLAPSAHPVFPAPGNHLSVFLQASGVNAAAGLGSAPPFLESPLLH